MVDTVKNRCLHYDPNISDANEDKMHYQHHVNTPSWNESKAYQEIEVKTFMFKI